MTPGFLIGAACTVALGYSTASVPWSAAFIGLVGLFLGSGTAGAIALAAMIYPVVIRSTGVGWAMGMGRLGQGLLPLAVGNMLGWGWGAEGSLAAIGLAPVIAAAFLLLLMWYAARSGIAPEGSALAAANSTCGARS